MAEPKWKSIAKGMLFGVLYCLVYLGLWRLSINQWYLPAGLRITGLMLLPYRYWPFLILGDAAALLVIRAPKVEKYSALWAYGTPFFIIMVVAVLPWLLRKRQTNRYEVARWLPFNALAIALWTTTWLFVMNYFLGGPKHLVTAQNFVSYSVGDFLGILMVALPTFLVLDWKRQMKISARLLWNTTASIAVIGSLYVIATQWVEDDTVLILTLLLMVLPAAYLTIKHGWIGAAIGILVVNLASVYTLPSVPLPGLADKSVLVAQEVLCVLAAMLLLFGWRITEHYERARRSGLEEEEAIKLAKSSFRFNERHVRDQLHYLALLQLQIDENRNGLVEQLKQERQYETALAVNNNGVAQKRLFEQQAAALYPQEIETGGLLVVLHSKAFKDFWIGDPDIEISFKGQPNEFSTDLQLNAYRCICRMITVLSECAPSEYILYSRVWRGVRGAGLLLQVRATPTRTADPTLASKAAWTELRARVKTHGGIVKRRHACGFSLWLPALPESEKDDQCPV